MVRYPESGKYRRTRLFVMTLGFSRKSVRLLVWKSSAKTWSELHEHVVSPSRRRAEDRRARQPARRACSRADVYDPAVNPLYRDVLTHYGVDRAAVSRAASRSQGQGRVRNRPHAAHAAEGHALRDARRGADVPRSSGTRAGPTRASTARRSVRSRRCLPTRSRTCCRCRSSRFATTATASAPCTSTATSRSTARTTPRRPATLVASLHVQWDERRVRLLEPEDGRAPARAPSAATRQAPDARPRTSRRGRRSRREQLLVARAHRRQVTSARSAPRSIGAKARSACAASSACLGLAKKHGAIAVDEACSLALAVGAPNYRFVRSYLERRPAPPLSLEAGRSAHP